MVRYNDLCEKCKKAVYKYERCLVDLGLVTNYDCTGIDCKMCWEGSNPEVRNLVLVRICDECKERE